MSLSCHTHTGTMLCDETPIAAQPEIKQHDEIKGPAWPNMCSLIWLINSIRTLSMSWFEISLIVLICGRVGRPTITITTYTVQVC